MNRAHAGIVLVTALVCVSVTAAPLHAQQPVWVAVRTPTGPASIAPSLLLSGRAELEALVRARPGIVLGNGSMVPLVAPPSAGNSHAYVIDVSIAPVQSASTTVLDVEVVLTDLVRGRTIAAQHTHITVSTPGDESAALTAALRGAWPSIAPHLRP